jgi:hypothetical protein
MKNVKFKLNSKPEKVIAAVSLSSAAAILFGSKKNGFFKQVGKNYRVIDNILAMTIARDVKKNEKLKLKAAEKASYKTKLRNLDIEDSIPFDIRGEGEP